MKKNTFHRFLHRKEIIIWCGINTILKRFSDRFGEKTSIRSPIHLFSIKNGSRVHSKPYPLATTSTFYENNIFYFNQNITHILRQSNHRFNTHLLRTQNFIIPTKTIGTNYRHDLQLGRQNGNVTAAMHNAHTSDTGWPTGEVHNARSRRPGRTITR